MRRGVDGVSEGVDAVRNSEDGRRGRGKEEDAR